ncbi:MAG: rhodanese-like domain-containing protein [Geobacteraceae bacterium]|nr:rhodanese-like domain-containing protein [Geobacteraceae bacterium]
MQAIELMRRVKAGSPPTVVDVRSGGEFKTGHVPGALNAPTWKILLRIADLPKDHDAELVVACEHGPRAQMAKGIISSMGYRNVTLLEGHMSGWRQAGLDMEK